ncbi:gliding motility-associated ABC transporter substrate-binding protein GldG [Myroides injenensis]|uniref:gliding motility-associated ABC transporter substrate-binding protein GldG n=1 Tax=Myroides injenensis TaxID=1183151 RepID=UPI000287F1E4|nr:gliding motility-associated ABC transporter substrate-binding protein GldG [Myroides injenensis]
MKKSKAKNLKSLLKCVAFLVIINVIGISFYYRFDLTQDKRYTLSHTTEEILDNITEQVVIDVFLDGKFPQGFKRLQTETRELLEEFSIRNPLVKFQFINPAEESGTEEDLLNFGLRPMSLTMTEKGGQTQLAIFPWAIVSKGEAATKVQLLKNMMGANTEEKVLTSVQHLEYVFADALYKLNLDKKNKIAVLKGNGELDDIYMADFLMSLRESYHIAPFTLDSVANNPVETLKKLQEYDLAIIAKPTKEFTGDQIETLDQFVMNGGKTLWLLDQVQADFDSLRTNQSMLVFPKDQSLGELLFKYGVRINPVLVKDEIATPIKLAIGRQGSETQYGEFMWKFAPFVYPNSEHPIVKNIEGLKLDFVSPIDTIKNNISKTILLESSKYSNLVGTPNEISLAVINEETTPEMYEGKGNYILGVLLEGEFTSVFKNRVLPFAFKDAIYESKPTKMIIVSDGDIIKNQLDNRGVPLELGYDKWMNKLYGNKEFLLNSVNYLLDYSGLINLRTKEVKIPMLDKVRVSEKYSAIQIIALVVPILLVIVLGVLFFFIGKRFFVKK